MELWTLIKASGRLYNAGIKTFFIVILEMIPGGRPANQTEKKKKKRINKYAQEKKNRGKTRMLLRSKDYGGRSLIKRKKRSGHMRNELRLPAIYFYYFFFFPSRIL